MTKYHSVRFELGQPQLSVFEQSGSLYICTQGRDAIRTRPAPAFRIWTVRVAVYLYPRPRCNSNSASPSFPYLNSPGRCIFVPKAAMRFELGQPQLSVFEQSGSLYICTQGRDAIRTRPAPAFRIWTVRVAVYLYPRPRCDSNSASPSLRIWTVRVAVYLYPRPRCDSNSASPSFPYLNSPGRCIFVPKAAMRFELGQPQLSVFEQSGSLYIWPKDAMRFELGQPQLSVFEQSGSLYICTRGRDAIWTRPAPAFRIWTVWVAVYLYPRPRCDSNSASPSFPYLNSPGRCIFVPKAVMRFELGQPQLSVFEQSRSLYICTQGRDAIRIRPAPAFRIWTVRVAVYLYPRPRFELG